jgi:CRISPR system Cascade subunit CasC
MSNHLGIRTKLLGVDIYKQLIAGGIKEKDAKDWTKVIAGVFGAMKKADKNDPMVELEIEQLVHVSPFEQQAVEELTEKLITEQRAPDVDELKLLRLNEQAVDIALFGRMLASSPAFNIEAACQVAHAISVHPVVIEDDYFTAVDDLNNGLEDMGAAHIGETRFAAGLFYSYICINRELLVKNLNGNEELANKAIRALTEAAVKVAPEGKQNSFASRAYASYVLAEKGNQQPRSLSIAYLKPINNRENQDFIADSITAIIKQKDSFDAVYGACADTRCELNVPKEQGTLAELLNFVGQ